MGMVASADAPAATRKNERRDRPLQAAGSEAEDICVNSSEVVGNSNRPLVADNRYECLRIGRRGSPHLKVSSKGSENKGEMHKEMGAKHKSGPDLLRAESLQIISSPRSKMDVG